MANVSDLAPRLNLVVSNAPSLIIKDALLMATRDFCKYTKAWKEYLTPIDSVADEPEYTVAPVTDAEVVEVTDVNYVGEELTKKSHKQLNRIEPKWRTKGGSPVFFTSESPSTIRLVKIPVTGVVGAIEPRAALQPTLSASTIDDDLVTRYLDIINDGALSILYKMKGKDWFDGNLAIYHERKFMDAKDDARMMATDDHMTGVSRKVKYGG